MIVSPLRILELNDEYNLIQGYNLDYREDGKPEGAGIDIRAGSIYKLTGGGYLGVEPRETSEVSKETPELTALAEAEGKEVGARIPSQSSVLVKTIEKVALPPDPIQIWPDQQPCQLMVDVYPRSTLQRCGVYFKGTKTDPGYEGQLVFALSNLSRQDFELELGARIATLVFKKIEGEVVPYKGQWQGGRVSTNGSEIQR